MEEKVLIVTHWFYPTNVPRAFRATSLAQELYKKGYDVDVVIGSSKKILKMSEFDQSKTELVGKQASNLKSKYFSIANTVFEYFFGERFYYTNRKIFNSIDFSDYSVVLSVGLPFYIHRMVHKKCKSLVNWSGKIISDWSDPYYKSHVKLAPYFKHIQKKIITSFDYVVVPIDDVVDYFSEFTNPEKIKVIPQGFDLADVQLAKYKKNENISFAYAGMFYSKIRNPEKILQYLSLLDKNFTFHIYTLKKGAIYENVLKKYEKKMDGKLVLHDIIPREQLLFELSKMDFLLNIENKTNNQLPSKLIDYGLTQRPILSISSDIKDFQLFGEFLNFEFKNALFINLEEYDIKNVSVKFIGLFGEEK
ncbi:glycosyltransferase family protein [Enterococcus sp. LJL99]